MGAFWKLAVPCDHNLSVFVFLRPFGLPGKFLSIFTIPNNDHVLRHFEKNRGWRVRVQWRWGLGCQCGPSGEVLCNFVRTRGTCAVRHPLSWWEGGGNSRRSFLACVPATSGRSVVLDFPFWQVQLDWDLVRGRGPAWTVCVGTEKHICLNKTCHIEQYTLL